MCGIAAIYNKSSGHNISDIGVQKHNLVMMMNRMKHRGPDGDGLFLHHRVGLGMVRLSIMGGSLGNQPIWNEDRTIVVVCNGEIYNYESLKVTLEQAGHHFSTKSDVEVIVHLYEQFQMEFINYLEGIFAIALWDTERERLVVARDRVGVKPLYYAETPQSLIFASEMQALLTYPKVNLDIDDDGFAAYHCLRFIPMNTTMLKGVKKVQPGQYIVIEGNDVSISHYWLANMKPEVKFPAGLVGKQRVEKLRKALFSAVDSQFATEVKSGVLLSGGMDSTALLAILQQTVQQELSAVTIAFARPMGPIPEVEYDETEQAARVAKRYGAEHICERYDAQEVLDSLPAIVAALDEPIADPTAIPLWFATRLARQAGLKVVYSGEGLDELFNGYEIYRQVYWLKATQRVPNGIRELAYSIAQKLGLPGQGLLSRSLSSPAKWYKGVGSVFSMTELKNLLSDIYLRVHGLPDPQIYVERMMNPVSGQSALAQMTYFDIRAWLPENTLAKSDKISMANAVELRVPFLHTPIVDLALQMNDREKLRFNCGKWIIKKALSGVIPDFVMQRKKAGFPVPLSAWMFHEWADYVQSVLLDANACTRGVYQSKQIEQLFKTPSSRRRRVARLLWTLLCFELWYRQVYVSASVKAACTGKEWATL